MSKRAAPPGSKSAILWFRKGLRVHDNAALLSAMEGVDYLHPLFVIDPRFANPDRVGAVRYRFLLESLADVDASLRKLGSQLFVARGSPAEVIPSLVGEWGITKLAFEKDSEPYAKARDAAITKDMQAAGVAVVAATGHTLHDLREYGSKFSGGKPPATFAQFEKMFDKIGVPELPTAAPSTLPPPSPAATEFAAAQPHGMAVPTMSEMGYEEAGEGDPAPLFIGGETEGLKRLDGHTARKAWIAAFEKPKTVPTTLEPSTTGLSPYMKFGCVSARRFWHAVASISPVAKQTSLLGQLKWREFNYVVAAYTPNFDRMEGNPACRQVPWDTSPELLAAWREGRTGYPFIDAIQAQLRTQGWIHHLARHATACFLTRGDLWQSWEQGQRVFEHYLVDADWSINAFNWMWLSCSGFFYQYFRVYSPVAFGKKYDPEGVYVRRWCPAVARLPKKYVFEPWKAPVEVQRQAGCVVGKDYPHPVVDHAEASKANKGKMAEAYKRQAALGEELSGVAFVAEGSVFGGGDAPAAGAGAGVPSNKRRRV